MVYPNLIWKQHNILHIADSHYIPRKNYIIAKFGPISKLKAKTIDTPRGSSGIWTRDLSHPKRESYP